MFVIADSVETTSSGLEAITKTFPVLTEGIKSVWDMIVANPVLALFVGASLVSVFIGLFVALRHSAN